MDEEGSSGDAVKVTIVCESMFGNTELLAAEVRDGLAAAGAEVALVDVREAESADFGDLDLLVVAAPTHALTLSRPESRAEAVAKGAEPARATVGVREWLEGIDRRFPEVEKRPVAAVFDTRVVKARHWPGSAAHRAARGLRRSGFQVVQRTSFFVEGLTGPLVFGERERARRWGIDLAHRRDGSTVDPSGAP